MDITGFGEGSVTMSAGLQAGDPQRVAPYRLVAYWSRPRPRPERVADQWRETRRYANRQASWARLIGSQREIRPMGG